MVGASVTDDLQEAVLSDEVDKPGNLVGMAFDDDPEILAWVDDAISGAIVVNTPFIYVRANVFQP